MLKRKPIFPNVIEINFQAGEVLGCCVYLIYDRDEWVLIDIGYDEIVEIIRQLDFPFAQCKTIIASHADVDHVQGLARVKSAIKTKVSAHPGAAAAMAAGDRLFTFAEIAAQGIELDMPAVKTENPINDGDVITVGGLELEVWNTPGHTDSQLAFRMGNLLFSGDNIFRDGCVGAIDAHHGSNIEHFIESLERIKASDVEWLLPSHGPVFRNDSAMIDKTIQRLDTYLHMADFGTCALDWPLMDKWEDEVAAGKMPE